MYAYKEYIYIYIYIVTKHCYNLNELSILIYFYLKHLVISYYYMHILRTKFVQNIYKYY